MINYRDELTNTSLLAFGRPSTRKKKGRKDRTDLVSETMMTTMTLSSLILYSLARIACKIRERKDAVNT